MHFISDDQIKVIREGSSNALFDIGLACAGGAAGFLQNFIKTTVSVAKGTIVAPMDGAFAAIFVGLVVSAVVLVMLSYRQAAPIKQLLLEIEKRQQKPVRVA